MARSKTKIPLKLLVDYKTKKVLFAEAGEDFVDFLFSLLTLPIGAVAKLISTGSVGRLYQSVERMGAPYLQPIMDKLDLLQPKVMPLDGDRDQLQQLLTRFPLYTCPRRCMMVTVDAWADYPQCGVGAAGPPATSDERGGGNVTYMVTDGLELKPITSSMSVISRFIVRKDVDVAVEVVVVGMDEGIALIEAALRSDTVLAGVFLFLARK